MSFEPNKIKGNIDPTKRRWNTAVFNPDGSVSSDRSLSFEDKDGWNVLIPSVIPDGKGGHKVGSPEEAIDHYRKTGEHFGKFRDVKLADRYANAHHEAEERAMFGDNLDEKSLQKRNDYYNQRRLASLGYEQGKKQAQKQYSNWNEWINDFFKR